MLQDSEKLEANGSGVAEADAAGAAPASGQTAPSDALHAGLGSAAARAELAAEAAALQYAQPVGPLALVEQRQQEERERQQVAVQPPAGSAQQQQEAGLRAPREGVRYGIARSNVGYQLLKRAGWREGAGLGAQEQGMAEPVAPLQQKGNLGLGFAPKQPKAKHSQAPADGGGAAGQVPGASGGGGGGAGAHGHAEKRALPADPLDKEDQETKVKRVRQVGVCDGRGALGWLLQRGWQQQGGRAAGGQLLPSIACWPAGMRLASCVLPGQLADSLFSCWPAAARRWLPPLQLQAPQIAALASPCRSCKQMRTQRRARRSSATCAWPLTTQPGSPPQTATPCCAATTNCQQPTRCFEELVGCATAVPPARLQQPPRPAARFSASPVALCFV